MIVLTEQQFLFQRVDDISHQIKVTDQKGGEPVLLRPHLTIDEVAYWQKRVRVLLPDCHATCQVAK